MRAQKEFLDHIAYNMRRSILIETSTAGSGHPTSALSAADIVAAIFFHAMQFDPKDHDNPDNDRFILSKGHASPVLYAVYKELGLLDDADLLTYRNFDSVLEGHPTSRFRWAEAATGSLGQGLSIGAGIALAARMDNKNYNTYVLMGDGEVAEGSIWEAAELAAYYELNNLIGVVDCNRLGQSDETMHGYHAERYAQKFEAFGWKALVVEGHDTQQLIGALDKACEHEKNPTVIIAKTIKGYGVAEAENKQGFHGKAFSKEHLQTMLDALAQRFSKAASYEMKPWQPKLPDATKNASKAKADTCAQPHYKLGEQVMTRRAFGQALAAAGCAYPELVSLDAEVKNSTFAELFEEKYPDRFVQCFIAEQNMIGMAVGLHSRGKIPVCSTFGAFFTRAFDQIRMASISRCPLRLVGSHAGVSIGEDGPSQMALEDIAMMRTILDSCVFYPCDGTSTWKLFEQMLAYDEGISYLRTTRMATPVIYGPDEQFPIGGCKIVRQSDHDRVCVVAAGITLHEALKAYDVLSKEDIFITVIDLYSIKPLDAKTVLAAARAADKKVITVEDHYLEGGLGQAVACALVNADIQLHNLAVKEMPRSGHPDELLAYEGIDAAHIIKKVKELIRRR